MGFVTKICFIKETNPDFISRTIMWVDKSNFSHTGSKFVDLDGKEKLFHSIGEGTKIDHEMEYFKDHEAVEEYEIPMVCSQDFFCGYVRGREGIEYSESQYINQFLRILARTLNDLYKYLGIGLVVKVTKMPFKNGAEKAICSETSSRTLEFSVLKGKKLPMDIDLMNPRGLRDFLKYQASMGRVKRLK